MSRELCTGCGSIRSRWKDFVWSPPAFQRPPWLRIEQRGSVALLKAIPESIRSELVSQREVGSVSIIFKILRVYQPGGLGERTTLLKQLVDQRIPSQLGEWLTSLRAWRRWLTRVQELEIQPPDPVLLLATLDRYAASLAKLSSQVAFRLQVTRAALRIDVAPTEHGIQQFAESLLAEGEATFHGGSIAPIKDVVKVKALDGDGGSKEDGMKPRDGKDKSKEPNDSKDSKDSKNAKSDGKGVKSDGKGVSVDKPVCRYFLSESGCKKGQKCSFPHEWKGVSKQGRCWTCGSTQHMKPDCPVKDIPKVKKEATEDSKTKEGAGKSGEGGGALPEALSSTSFHPPTVQPSEDLVKEAVQLLKSLRPSMKAIVMRSVNPKDGVTRALLDGGATHVLRPASSPEEYDKAIPIKVELAAGVTTLRQVETTGTLLTDFETQTIVPLGKVIKLGYKAKWESDSFELWNPSGKKVDVQLEAGCPTVELKVANLMIAELESYEAGVNRRVMALREGNPGDIAPSVWKWLTDLRALWPEVPDELIARVVPMGKWSSDQVPLNRRQRQRVMASSSVILHLFSGPNQSWWRKQLDSNTRTVVCIDKTVDPAQDLLSDHLTGFLAEVCEKGTVDVVLGGPPCRTVSKLRFRRPGPPPLRSRKGPERFALSDLLDSMRELAYGDAVLWMRQLWLYTLASAARQRAVLFLKEHPRDPEEYKQPNDPVEYPSFFAWPEWAKFRDTFGLKEVRLDLGALGHERRKPTTLGTNIPLLFGLNGMTDHQGRQQVVSTDAPIEERTSQSRAWAAWPLKFKEEIVKAIVFELDAKLGARLPEDLVNVSKMSADQWKDHVLNDHVPFSRECTTCLKGGGKSRQHRRVPHPDAMTLSLDVCGPFRPGEDFRKKSRYFLVGVYAIPVRKTADGEDPLLQSMVDALAPQEEDQGDHEGDQLLPEALEEEVEYREGDAKRLEEWERLEVEAEEVIIRNYTLVETLSSRQGSELKAGMARMIARLKYLGMEVRRVHSDGAAEMMGTRRWCEDRGIYRTFTSGSDFKANGRAEAEVGVIRRGINTLIRASEEGEDLWPLMAKHIGERRGRLQLKALGFSTPALLPWGRKVMVTTKGWDDFQGHWRHRKKPGIVRGPDPEMSLTSGGHVVEIEKGKYIRTNDIIQADNPPSLEDVVTVEERPEPANILDGSVIPRRRLREKTSLSCLSISELQGRLHRGQEWANEEFSRLEVAKSGEEEAVALVYDLDRENEKIEGLVPDPSLACRKLEAEASRVAEEAEELFLQTRTVSLQEVRKSLHLWIPPLRTEIDNFDGNNAIKRIDEEQTRKILADAQEKGERAELIPGMGVFTRKAGDGRRRARIVCCGNYMEPRAGDEVYATGADSTQLRAILRVAALRQWECLSLDVKSAFLLAPKAQGETVIVKPPKILEEAGLAKPGEHWLVTSAMYGLVTSPKDWSSFRDAELQKMVGEFEEDENDRSGRRQFSFRPMEDPKLWPIQEFTSAAEGGDRQWGRTLGHMIVYVDDVLMVGPKTVMEAAASTIQNRWSTSAPEFATVGGDSMRFLGIEIRRLCDGSYLLHQECYAREVLERHPGVLPSPFIKVPEEFEEEEAVSLPKVKEAQKITGELLWLSGKTRPDLSWAVMKMAQNAVKKPRWTVELGKAVLAYMRSTLDFGLHYTSQAPVDKDPDLQRGRPRHDGTLEVLVDASFSPGDGHSVSGTIILLAGCRIQWESKKQTLMALSTAEAELTALVDGLQTGRSVRALIQLITSEVDLELYNDNRAAVILASGAGGGWRTRHLRIRACGLSEALKNGELSLSHRVGTSLWADGLTKPLPAHHLGRFCRGIWLGGPDLGGDEPRHPKDKKALLCPVNGQMMKSMSLMAAGLPLLPGAHASDTCETKETRGETGSWADQGWILLLACLVCVLHFIKELGWELCKRLLSKEESLKVTLLNDQAILPCKGSRDAAGWDLASTVEVGLQPGERRLVPLGLSLEVPPGCYGRIAPRSSMAARGIDVAGGVIDADYRGEVKVILVNNSPETFVVHQGDRIGQLILEKIAQVKIETTSQLSSTVRGDAGFGSTGVGSRRHGSTIGEASQSPGFQEPSVRRVALTEEHASFSAADQQKPSVGPHVFFDGVHYAKEGESIAAFIKRLRAGELLDHHWMFPDSLINELERPSKGTPTTLHVEVMQGTLNIMIYKHEDWRKKLYDTEVGAPPSNDGITAGVVTLGRLEDGRGFARVDNRRGNRAMIYMKQSWKGMSLFYSLTNSC